MLSNFSKVSMTNISFTAVLNNGASEMYWWHSEKHQEEIYLRIVTCEKQSCCKDKMLPGYTSLLKKLSNFPNALTGTIFLLLY